MKINEISSMLYSKKIINNKFAFNLWIKFNFLKKKLNSVNSKLLVKIQFIMLLKNFYQESLFIESLL